MLTDFKVLPPIRCNSLLLLWPVHIYDATQLNLTVVTVDDNNFNK